MIIRSATQEEFHIAIQWAKDEGWNPGLDDLDAFFAADPNGFLMGFENEEPISSISVIRYGEDYGFLGFYIVRPDKRRTGAGFALWKAGLDYLKGRTVGLDGVIAQQANYEKSGFVNTGRNIRFSGRVTTLQSRATKVKEISESDLRDIIEWDTRFFPADRSAFLMRWLTPHHPTRRTMLVRQGDAIAGYGTIRHCVEGYKIGPLFAENDKTAEALFCALAGVADGEEIVLDVPESNDAAKRLAQNYNLRPSFETARMYLGKIPKLDSERTFGITTFELG